MFVLVKLDSPEMEKVVEVRVCLVWQKRTYMYYTRQGRERVCPHMYYNVLRSLLFQCELLDLGKQYQKRQRR